MPQVRSAIVMWHPILYVVISALLGGSVGLVLSKVIHGLS